MEIMDHVSVMDQDDEDFILSYTCLQSTSKPTFCRPKPICPADGFEKSSSLDFLDGWNSCMVG